MGNTVHVTHAYECKTLRNTMNMYRPKSNKGRKPVSPKNVTVSKKAAAVTWQESYWDTIGALLAYGGGLFMFGLIFAIVVAGVGFIIAALLCWSIAILMVVTYPIWLFIDWVYDLFHR